jgi:hypothetical protein
MDAYVLREMHRRCNYDQEAMEQVARDQWRSAVATKRRLRDDFLRRPDPLLHQEQYQRSTLASAVILPHLTDDTSVEACR